MTQVQLHQLELYLSHHQAHGPNVLLFILPAVAVLLDSCVVITVGMHLKKIARKAVMEAADDVRASMEEQFPILKQLPDMLNQETFNSINELAQHTRGFRNALRGVLSIFDRDAEQPTGTVTFIAKK